jgi:hypothetical protein
MNFYNSKIQSREKIAKINPIRIQNYIRYEDNVIGIESDGLYYYFKPTTFDALANLPNASIRNLLYHPDELNKALTHYKITSPDIAVYKKALYKKNIHILASIEFMESVPLADILNARDIEQFLRKHFAKIFVIGEPNYDDAYLITRCRVSRSMYCKGDKLIISKDMMDDIIKALARDINNPVKRKMLENNTNIFSIIEKFDFALSEHERIYINIYER